jgi:nicotinamidase/pyrazinamidase
LYLAGLLKFADNEVSLPPQYMNMNRAALSDVATTKNMPKQLPYSGAKLEGKKALILIDLQNDFFPGGKLPVKSAESIIDPIKDFVAKAKSKGWEIIKTLDWHPHDHETFISDSNPEGWAVHCVAGSRGAEIHPALVASLDGASEILLGKTSSNKGYSACEDPNMDKFIAGCSEVYVAGLALEYCVTATLNDLLLRGRAVFVIKDLVRAADESKAESSWQKLASDGVRVISSREVTL